MYTNILLGSDPELFITTQQGHLIASCGLIGGTKEEPRPIDKEGCAVQEDNVAVEFNIPPAKTREEFTGSLNHVLDYLSEFLHGKDLVLSCTASAVFPEDQLVDARAQVFGCDPDYNAWTGKVNPKPLAKNPNLRSCGGHVHVGFDDPSAETVQVLMQTLDLFLGVPSVLYDEDKARRELYGKAGSFRFKPYGGEYRTLSNWWVSRTDYMEYVYDQVQRAVAWLNSGNKINKKDIVSIRSAINKSNISLASGLMQEYNLIGL
jgi:hypothetical protein